MDNNNQENGLLTIYEKLKDEQLKRIEFRDHMVYLTLVVIGAVFAFALENSKWVTALLVLPFIVFVLGWMYINNDQKISAISDYCRDILLPKMTSSETWEEYNLNASGRLGRKRIQFFTDLGVFCISGIFALSCYYYLVKDIQNIHYVVFFIETSMLIFLAYRSCSTFERDSLSRGDITL